MASAVDQNNTIEPPRHMRFSFRKAVRQSGSLDSRQAYGDAFHLRVMMKRFNSFLTTNTALLEPTHRRLDATREILIDVDLARLKRCRDTMCPTDVPSPYSSSQPIVGIVGDADSLLFIGEGDYGHNGTEDFLACDSHAVRNARVDRRFHIPA